MLSDPEEDYRRGSVPFLGVAVRLDSRPLIPRAETEYWVERAIATMTDVRRPSFRVLDMFAGSGCIGLAVLKHVPGAHVTFAEKEDRHFRAIRKSIAENFPFWSTSDVSKKTSFVPADVWTPLPSISETKGLILGGFDVVLANPPYVSKERGTVAESVTIHEPHEAIFAPDDGFFYIRHILDGLPTHLLPGGICYIEHEPRHAARLAAASPYGAKAHQDQYGVVRYSRIDRKI